MYDEQTKSTNGVGAALFDFTQAVSAISSSHRDLQKKIEDLDFKLTDKNLELQGDLGETQGLKTYLDCILDSMSNCMIVIDKIGRITVFNKAAERLTGYEAEEVYGASYSELFCNQISERFTPFYILKTGNHFTEGEKEIITRDGKKVPVKFSASLLTDSDNRILGAIEVFTDLSAIRALDEQMHRINILSALTDMAAVVAHEIRNPLSGIGGYAALLSDDLKADAEKRQMAERIVEGVKRLDGIVENLLSLTRTKKPTLVEADLGEFLNRYIAKLITEVDFTGKNIVLQKIVPDISIKTRIDPVLMGRALWNIIDNAVHAMPKGGTLQIEMAQRIKNEKRPGCFAYFSVTDTGTGMSSQTMDRLFSPFFTTRERGVGLGLAIAKNLIKFQHCNIGIRSTEGKGTTVVISIPLTEECR
jgi:PAS domain S-box-containing protein